MKVIVWNCVEEGNCVGAYVKYAVFLAEILPMVALWTETSQSAKVYGP